MDAKQQPKGVGTVPVTELLTLSSKPTILFSLCSRDRAVGHISALPAGPQLDAARHVEAEGNTLFSVLLVARQCQCQQCGPTHFQFTVLPGILPSALWLSLQKPRWAAAPPRRSGLLLLAGPLLTL